MAQVARVNRLSSTIVSCEAAISDAIAQLEIAGTGALLTCDEHGILRGVLTDGDVRRALLRGITFDKPCSMIANHHPVVARDGCSAVEALRLMDHGREFVLNHLPVVDEQGRVVDLLLRSDLVTDERLGLSAVIMAGGLGSRMRPWTDQVPKPMLPVGDKPLLELTIARLRDAGIRRVNVTTHYLADKITGHFGNGDDLDIEINYVTEDRPLGTAGGLKLVGEPSETMLVINGDILTEVDFRSLLAYHRDHGADATVCVRQQSIQMAYGVVECDGVRVRNIREKPVISFLVNAGIYLLEPSAHRYIPDGRHFDMPDLIDLLIEKGRHVVSFPILEYWRDIGAPVDYFGAQEDVKNGTYGK